MDQSPLLPLGYASPPGSRPSRPFAPAGIAVTVILAGMFAGGTTDTINAVVSPTYFIKVMGWQLVPPQFRAMVAEGILEGLVAGAMFSAMFTAAVGIIARGTCTYRKGVGWLGGIMLGVYGFWFIGGIAGVVLAALWPQFFQRTFIGVPSDLGQMLRYAWVGGSIWGAYVGSPLSVIVGLVLFRTNWRRMLERQSGGGA